MTGVAAGPMGFALTAAVHNLAHALQEEEAARRKSEAAALANTKKLSRSQTLPLPPLAAVEAKKEREEPREDDTEVTVVKDPGTGLCSSGRFSTAPLPLPPTPPCSTYPHS